jgi:hypothetical protein
MSLCQYKDIFGSPNTGLHSYRIGGMAAVDLALTFAGAVLIGNWMEKNIIGVFIFLIILSIAMHWLFCVSTTLLTASENIYSDVLSNLR